MVPPGCGLPQAKAWGRSLPPVPYTEGAVSHSQLPQSTPHQQSCLVLPLAPGAALARGLSRHKGKVGMESCGDLLNQECTPKCSRAASLMEGGYKALAAGTKHTGDYVTERETPAHLES